MDIEKEKKTLTREQKALLASFCLKLSHGLGDKKIGREELTFMASGFIGRREHTCHFPSCNTVVPPKMWGCKKHWFKLPKNLRNKVWATYREGQEIDKNPSEGYLKVAKEVEEWCLANPDV